MSPSLSGDGSLWLCGAALEAPSLPSSAVLASADMDIFNFGVFCEAVEMSPSISGDGSLWLRVEQL